MLPGRWRGKDVTILTTYEGVGSVLAGTMTEAELDELGHACAPTLGSCPGQFTANTMAMVAETLGLAMPGSAMLPAVYAERLALARRAGRRAAEIVQGRRAAAARPGHEASRWRTPAPRSPPPAARPTPACTCRRSPTRPASASRLDDVAAVFARTPLIADLQPGGRFLARRPAPRRRRRRRPEGAARRRPPARRHARPLRPHARRGARRRRRARRRGGARRRPRPARHRRRGRPQGQPRPGRCADQDRRPEERGLRRPGARVRVRGGRLRRRQRRAPTGPATCW